MREILFRGKLISNNEWIEGYYIHTKRHHCIITSCINDGYVVYGHYANDVAMEVVAPETVGQYTGMNEFVVTDKSFNKPLFEGDIVEVWGFRGVHGYKQSQYDGFVKARAAICFKDGKWQLDYDNAYNKSLCKLRGNEQDERIVGNSHELYYFGYRCSNEDWYREHNKLYKWGDIVKIGNIYDNPELLEV